MITILAGVKLHPGCKRLLLLSHKTISEPYRRILLTKRRWPVSYSLQLVGISGSEMKTITAYLAVAE